MLDKRYVYTLLLLHENLYALSVFTQKYLLENETFIILIHFFFVNLLYNYFMFNNDKKLIN